MKEEAKLRHSIIRRSLGVVTVYVCGHAFNYLLLITTNRFLAPEVFGLFYICVSLINILVTPGLTVVWSLAQRLSVIATEGARSAVLAELWRNLRLLLGWGIVVAAAISAALLLFGRVLGVDSLIIIPFIPAIALASILVEMVRGAFQAVQRFAWFSATWILWCALQYCFATAGLLLVGTVWSGLVGLLLAATVIAVLGWVILVRAAGAMPESSVASSAGMPLDLGGLAPLVGGYGLFTLFVNLDVLVAYFLLDRQQLGAYVASSLLPKAIVTATLPVAQVLMPVVVARAKAAQSTRPSLLKALLAVIVLATTGALVLNLGGGLVCNSRLGLRFCDFGLMMTLAAAAVPLCALRVLVVADLALSANWRPLLQLLGILLVAVPAALLHAGPARLAALYLHAAAAVTLLYLAVEWLAGPRRAALRQP
jgi:O-antigen/teichoic acid export membrane protein